MRYGEVLQLDRLLPLVGVRPGRAGEAADMTYFLAVHQGHELWFAVILGELDAIASALRDREPAVAADAAERMAAAATVLLQQMHVLDALSAGSFDRIRDELGSASGIQSAQYREIEYACGVRDRRYLNTAGFSDTERRRLADRLATPPLAAPVAVALAEIGAGPPAADEARLVRALLEFDRVMYRWRYEHVVTADRFIGDATGTGGSAGVDYLRGRLDAHLFGDVLEALVAVAERITATPVPVGSNGKGR